MVCVLKTKKLGFYTVRIRLAENVYYAFKL